MALKGSAQPQQPPTGPPDFDMWKPTAISPVGAPAPAAGTATSSAPGSSMGVSPPPVMQSPIQPTPIGPAPAQGMPPQPAASAPMPGQPPAYSQEVANRYPGAMQAYNGQRPMAASTVTPTPRQGYGGLNRGMMGSVLRGRMR